MNRTIALHRHKIIVEGTLGSCMYIVESGEVDVIKRGAGGTAAPPPDREGHATAASVPLVLGADQDQDQAGQEGPPTAGGGGLIIKPGAQQDQAGQGGPPTAEGGVMIKLGRLGQHGPPPLPLPPSPLRGTGDLP